MKRIWIINHYAQTPDEAGGIRHYSLAKYLRQHGWQTSIIANSVEHNTGRQRVNKEEKYRLEKVDDVEFLWLQAPSYKGNGYGRIWNMLIFTKAVLSLHYGKLLTRPDIVIGSSVHPLAAWAGLKLANYYSVPFIFEVRDLWPETLIQFGRLSRRSPPALGLAWLERKLAREAAHIISVLPRAADYFSRYGIPPARISWLPNGTDDANSKPTPSAPADNSFMLTYLGTHGNANCLETLIDALGQIKHQGRDNNIRCQLVGDGPLKPGLQAKAEALGLDNIAFYPSVARDKLFGIAQTTNAFVLCAKDCPGLYQYGVSMNKLFDYMAMAKPIVAALQAADDPVTGSACGLLVKPEAPQALAEGILQMAALSADERKAMGMRGRSAVETRYNYRALAKELAVILNKLCAK